MSVQTNKVPPVPQLVPPLQSLKPVSIELKDLRFENSWMQWFTQVKFKIDSINLNVVSISELTGQGIVFRSTATGFRSGSIAGTSGRIDVTNGDGVAGNPTIDFNNSGVDARVNAGIANHVAQSDPHTQYALVVAVPATATSPGNPGEVAFDATFFYACYATDTWVRAALATW